MEKVNILLLLTIIYTYFSDCDASLYRCGLQDKVPMEFKINKKDLHLFDSVQELKEHLQHGTKHYKYVGSHFKDQKDFKFVMINNVNNKHWHNNQSIIVESNKGQKCNEKHVLYDNENDEKHGKPVCISSCLKDNFHVERYQKKLICLPCIKENTIWCEKGKKRISVCSYSN